MHTTQKLFNHVHFVYSDIFAASQPLKFDTMIRIDFIGFSYTIPYNCFIHESRFHIKVLHTGSVNAILVCAK